MRSIHPLKLVSASRFDPAWLDDSSHNAARRFQQSQTVFLGGNNLPHRWQSMPTFTILETGFGCGLHFLTTWQAWHDAPGDCVRLNYVAIEPCPLGREDLAQLHTRWPHLAPFAAALQAAWPLRTPGYHRVILAEGRLALTLIFGALADVLPTLPVRANAIYLDGESPHCQPQLWDAARCQALARVAAPEASLASYRFAVHVQQRLQACGMVLHKGREVGAQDSWVGRFPAYPSPGLPIVPDAKTTAIVIGAGLAGCAATERLAARGVAVTLIERHLAPAQGTSGNAAGILAPLITADDSAPGRLSRSSYLFALSYYAGLRQYGGQFEACGVLQQFADADEHARFAQTLAKLGWPAEFAQSVDHAQACLNSGVRVAHGGAWFAGGGWAVPPSLCAAMLLAAGQGVTRVFNREALHITHHAGQWQVWDATHQLIAHAPVLVLASAFDTLQLLPEIPLGLVAIRGQTSRAALPALAALRCVLCGEGYATPRVNGEHIIGATFHPHDLQLDVRLADHAENLAQLAGLVPGAASGIDPAALQGRAAIRTAARDRMPLVGAVPNLTARLGYQPSLSNVVRQPGLYVSTGLGARGLVWAPLAAEYIASHVAGEPLPLPQDVIDSMDPARFWLRKLRRSGGR